MGLEKMIVVVISFEGVVLNGYRGKEEREPFMDGYDLKSTVRERFWRAKKGCILG